MKKLQKSGTENSLPITKETNKPLTEKELVRNKLMKNEELLYNNFDSLMQMVIKDPSIYPGNIWLDIAEAGYKYRYNAKALLKSYKTK